MSKAGRPKGTNNKEYSYTIRMDERTKARLDSYCKKMNVAKADAIRDGIMNLITEGKEKKEI